LGPEISLLAAGSPDICCRA